MIQGSPSTAQAQQNECRLRKRKGMSAASAALIPEALGLIIRAWIATYQKNRDGDPAYRFWPALREPASFRSKAQKGSAESQKSQ
jgi:hypothetical protein